MAATSDAHRKNGNGAGNGHIPASRALARRALDWNTEPEVAKPAAPSPQPAEAPQPLLSARFASDIAIHGDDVSAEYDLIFKARRKQVTSEGQVIPSLRSVVAVTIPPRTVLELFDALEPIAQLLRPPIETAPGYDATTTNRILGLTPDGRFKPGEGPEEAPKKKTRHKTPDGVTPRGFEAIMNAARKITEARANVITAVGGATSGGPHNKAMHKWLRENGMDDMPSHLRNDLYWIGNHADELSRWAETQPLSLFANLPPSGLIRQYHKSPPPPAPEPKPIKPALRKRSHKKKPPTNGAGEQVAVVTVDQQISEVGTMVDQPEGAVPALQ